MAEVPHREVGVQAIEPVAAPPLPWLAPQGEEILPGLLNRVANFFDIAPAVGYVQRCVKAIMGLGAFSAHVKDMPTAGRENTEDAYQRIAPVQRKPRDTRGPEHILQEVQRDQALNPIFLPDLVEVEYPTRGVIENLEIFTKLQARLKTSEDLLYELKFDAAFQPRTPLLLLQLKNKAKQYLAGFDLRTITNKEKYELIMAAVVGAFYPDKYEQLIDRFIKTDQFEKTTKQLDFGNPTAVNPAHVGISKRGFVLKDILVSLTYCLVLVSFMYLKPFMIPKLAIIHTTPPELDPL